MDIQTHAMPFKGMAQSDAGVNLPITMSPCSNLQDAKQPRGVDDDRIATAKSAAD